MVGLLEAHVEPAISPSCCLTDDPVRDTNLDASRASMTGRRERPGIRAFGYGPEADRLRTRLRSGLHDGCAMQLRPGIAVDVDTMLAHRAQARKARSSTDLVDNVVGKCVNNPAASRHVARVIELLRN